MSSPEKALAERIRELRRRHFGPRGKARFAQRLGMTLEEYTRFERGVVPPGETMVRMCEATGEDLQWLLTGVAGRGTVVISGTRGRHQDLLARMARLLDEQPRLAAPVEAFVDLLARGEQAVGQRQFALPGPRLENLVPIFEPRGVPRELPGGSSPGSGRFDLACFADAAAATECARIEFAEPAMKYAPELARAAELLTLRDADGASRVCVHSDEIARCFPNAFAMRLADDSMRPMFEAGDAAVVAVGAEPRIGRPAVFLGASQPEGRCRIWLGEEAGVISLGRLADGETERVARDDLLWSLEVLFRLARAA